MTRWIDLSHAYHLQRFTFITHPATHVDAPLHFIKSGRTIDTYGPGELGGVLVAGNLANLQKVAGRKLTIGAFPLKIKGVDGAPARIFAVEE